MQLFHLWGTNPEVWNSLLPTGRICLVLILPVPSMIPLPGDIPLPAAYQPKPVHGILKKPSAYDRYFRLSSLISFNNFELEQWCLTCTQMTYGRAWR